MTAIASASRNYAVDPSHSSVHFSVRHMMIAKVRGTFHTISGTVTLPADSPIPTAVNVVIDASSNLGNLPYDLGDVGRWAARDRRHGHDRPAVTATSGIHGR